MGLLNDIKKILFGSKSITKSVVKKSADFAKDKTEHLLDTSEDFFDNQKDEISEKFDKIKTKAETKSNKIIENVTDKSKEVIENIKDSEIYKQSSESIEKVGDIIADTGEKFIEKTKDFIEGPGNEIAEKFKDSSEKVGSKIIEGGKTIFEKATELTKDLGEKMDKTIQEAENLAKTKAKSKDIESEFADSEINIKESNLDDEFFKKADKYAAGEYQENPEPRLMETKEKEKNSSSDIAGFDDRDNDGNPLIDDANIIDENNKESTDNKND